MEILDDTLELEECKKKSVEIFTNTQLDNILLESSRAGHIKVMEILIQYKIRNFEFVIDTLPVESNFSLSFIRLCKSISDGDTKMTSLFLEGNPDQTGSENEKIIPEMKLIQPLLQDEYFKLSVLFLLAVENKNIVSACEIFLKSKNFLLNQARSLNFSGCLLPEIQSFFNVLPINIDLIVEVNLNFNRLTILDSSLCDLPNLTKLSVSHNKLWLISNDILQMKNLLHLDLSYNVISELSAIFISRRIKYLYLQGNQFRHFPSCLENSYLIDLNLSNNKLVDLSSSISTVRYLMKLDLSCNPYLLQLPTSLGKLEVALNLEGTQSLMNVPSSIGTDTWAFYNQRLVSEVTYEFSQIIMVDACNEIEFFNAARKNLENEFVSLPFINLTTYGVPFGFQHVHEILAKHSNVYLIIWQIDEVDVNVVKEISNYLGLFDSKSPIHVGIIFPQCTEVDIMLLKEELNLGDEIKLHILKFEAGNIPIFHTEHMRDELILDAHLVKNIYKVPGCYIEIQDTVKDLRERYKKEQEPTISKSDFWEKIRSSLDNSDLFGVLELGAIIEFLENTGYISYFPSNNHGCEDMIFLDPDWLVGLVEHIIGRSTHSSLYLNSYTITQLGLEEIFIRYSKSHPPAGLCYFLAQNAIAMPLEQNSWFVPSVLTPEYLPEIPNANYIFFAMDYQPWSLWVRFIAHILNSLPVIVAHYNCQKESTPEDIALTRYRITKWGILLQKSQNYIFRVIQKRNDFLDTNGIELSVPRTDNGYQVMRLINSYLYSLTKHWYPKLLRESIAYIYCPICIENNLKSVHCYCWISTICEILEDVSLTCPNHSAKIHISELLPSFYPEDISGDITTQSSNFYQIRQCSILGLGVGTFRDMDVLFKEFPNISEGTMNKKKYWIEMHNAWAEIEIHYELRNLETPFLHKLIVFSTKPLICAMESGPSCNLENLIFVRKVELNYNFKVRILTQVCEGLYFLHKSKIMHRKISTDSVLVCSLSYDTEVNVKLGNFENAASTMFVGFLRQKKGEYPAPEMLSKEGTMEYEERTDIFSFAFLIYEVCTGLKAFEFQREKIEELINYGFRPSCPKMSQLAFGVTTLMENCWKKSPSRRPFAEEALKFLKVPLTGIVQAQQELKRIDVFYLADITHDFDRNLVIVHGNQGIKLDLLNSMTLDRITTTLIPSQFIVALVCARNFIFLSAIENSILVLSSNTLDILHTKELDAVVICIEIIGDIFLAGDENGKVTIFEMDINTGNISLTYQIEANSNPIKTILFSKGKVYLTSKEHIHIFSIGLMEMKHYLTNKNVGPSLKEIQGLRITHSNDCLHFYYRRELILHTWDAITMQPLTQVNLTPQIIGDKQKQKHYIMSIESCDPWLFLGLSTGYVFVFSTIERKTQLLNTFHIHSSSLRSLQILNIQWPPSTMLFTLGEGFSNLPMVRRTGRTLTIVKESMYGCILDIFPVLPRDSEIETNTFQRLSAQFPPLKEYQDSNESDYYETMKPSRSRLLRSLDLMSSMSITLDPTDFLDIPITDVQSSSASNSTLSFDTTSSSNISDN